MSTGTKYNQVYDHELAVITRGRELLGAPCQPEGLLLEEYRKLLGAYERLFKMSKKISAISDAQGTMLKQRENDISSLLDHANQGFLTVGESQSVNKSYSRECARIFERRIGGEDISELLSGGDPELRRSIRKGLRQAFASAARLMPPDAPGLPKLVTIGSRRIAVEYKRIDGDDTQPGDERLMMLILTDVTERLESEAKVNYLSNHDSLTSLFNRSYVEPLLACEPPAGEVPCSLFVIDLNGLKLCNDVFGHRAGDRLLMRAAELLSDVLADASIVARWGGDEFVALLPGTDEAACADYMNRLEAACRATEADPVRLSMAIGSATLSRPGEPLLGLFIAAEKMMYKRKLLESKRVRADMMKGVTDALLTRGIEDERNLKQLLDMAAGFAGHLGIAEGSSKMKLLHMLVKLHDAGNLALPYHILRKPGPLDEEEWEIMKSHSEIGYRMAQSIGEWALAEAILGMHERWDGKGYPYGLAGDQIPYMSRLLAIVDAYDVMTHDQVYKKAIAAEDAKSRIRDAAGRQFDPELVQAFLAWAE